MSASAPIRVILACLLLATAVCAQYYSPVVAAGKTNIIKIGLIGPFNMPNLNSLQGGHQAGLGFLIALDEINARTDLLPRHQLVGYWNNTNSEAGQAIAAAFYLVQNMRVSGLVGEYTSDISQQTSFVSRMYGTPMISYGSISTVFNNKALYGTFFRALPDVSSQAIAAARLIARLGWRNCAYISTNSGVDLSAAAAFTAEAKQLGLAIRAVQTVQAGAACDPYTLQMQQLKNSRCRIFMLFAVIADARCIALAAQAAGIWGQGYVWIGEWILVEQSLWVDANNAIIPQWFNLFDNFIGVVPEYNSNGLFAPFSQKFAARPLSPPFTTAANRSANFVSVLAYDSTYAFATAWHNCTNLTTPALDIVGNPSSATSALRSVNLAGVSGALSFDGSQNRVMGMEVLQIRQGKLVSITTTDATYTISASAAALEAAIVWQGGSKPTDLDPIIVVSIGAPTLTAAIVVAAVGCAVALTLGALIFWFRTASIIKAASPMLQWTTLLGCCLAFVSLPMLSMDEGNASAAAVRDACRSYTFLLSTGCVLVFGSFFAKSYRIHKIFNADTLKRVAITDAWLMLRLGTVTAAMIFINIVWVSYDPLLPLAVNIDSFTVSSTCASGSTTAFAYVIFIFIGILMLSTCILCWRIRKAPSEFNEARQVMAATYQLTLVAILAALISTRFNDPQFAAAVRVVGIGLGVFALMCILFVSDLVTLVIDPAAAVTRTSETSTVKAASSTASASKRHSRGASQRIALDMTEMAARDSANIEAPASISASSQVPLVTFQEESVEAAALGSTSSAYVSNVSVESAAAGANVPPPQSSDESRV